MDRGRKKTGFLARPGIPLFFLVPYAVAGLLAYANSLASPFVFDDLFVIVNDPTIHLEEMSPKNLWRAAWAGGSKTVHRPVARASFAVDWRIGSGDARVFHLVNVAIHILNAWLAALLLVRLGRRVLARGRRAESVAFTAGLIFLLHPVQTQSVTYIVQRMTSLSALFWLVSFHLYLAARLSPRRGPVRWGAAAAAALTLALGCKQTAVTFVPAALLVEYFILGREGDGKRTLRLLAPSLALTVLASLWYAGLFHAGQGEDYFKKILPRQDFSLTERLATEPRVFYDYASLVFLPLPSRLNADPDPEISRSPWRPASTVPSWILLALALAYAFRVRRSRPVVGASLAWFFLLLLPEATLANLAPAFEHRLYLPLLGPAVLAAGFLVGPRRFAGPCLEKNLPPVLGTLFLAVLLAAGTYARNLDWRGPLALWADTARKSPGKGRVRYNYGKALKLAGEFDKSRAELLEAARLDPSLTEAWTGLGHLELITRGPLEKALEYFEEALRADPANTTARYDAAEVLLRLGRPGEAEKRIDRALSLSPGNPKILNLLGNVWTAQGRTEEAVEIFRRLLSADPRNAKAWNNLALAYYVAGEKEKTRKALSEALRLRPDLARRWEEAKPPVQ